MSRNVGECPICHATATKRCNRCKAVYYCGKEHQVEHWKSGHKAACINPQQQQQQQQADQYTLHKEAFDRIVKKYKLDTEEKSEEIADFLTTTQSNAEGGDGGETTVSPSSFAEKFGTDVEEAVVFLEWIKVGVKFKEQAIDAAKKSGLGGGR